MGTHPIFESDFDCLTEIMKYGVVDVPDKGRGLVARSAVDEGEVLFEESPICSAQMAWGAKLNYKCCAYCMIPLESESEAACRLTNGKILSVPNPKKITRRPSQSSPVPR